MILADYQIREMAQRNGLIAPFLSRLNNAVDGVPVASFGPSGHGYDLRLGRQFALYRDSDEPLDTMNVTWADLHRFDNCDSFVVPPQTFALAHTLEKIALPETTIALLLDKSSLARCGISVFNTIFEAGWRGCVTIEIFNTLRRPVRLHAGQGIGQAIFLQGAAAETDYGTRKYQDQPLGITLPKRASA